MKSGNGNGTTYEQMKKEIKEKGTLHFVLIDPDKQKPEKAGEIAAAAEKAGSAAVMIGGSGGDTTIMDDTIAAIKQESILPTIIFPGNISDISRFADAIFFMSLMNSRSRYYLSMAQAYSAGAVKKFNLEPIGMGYVVVESDVQTSIGFFGDVNGIPRYKPHIAASFGLAAEYMGMKCFYLEGGSGANQPVEDEMITVTKKAISIPLLVGGGIKDGKTAAQKALAGADIIVTGTCVEEAEDVYAKVKEIVDGINSVRDQKLNK